MSSVRNNMNLKSSSSSSELLKRLNLDTDYNEVLKSMIGLKVSRNQQSLPSSSSRKTETTELPHYNTENQLTGLCLEDLVVSDSMKCGTCDYQFDDRNDQLEHYKLDWHRFNLKRKLQKKSIMDEGEFEDIASDVSSISGSESDSNVGAESRMGDVGAVLNEDLLRESEETRKNEKVGAKACFMNSSAQSIYIQRCIIHGKKNVPETQEELVGIAMEAIRPERRWAIFLVSCGHFAGAVFSGNEVVVHKTFHRYTVRAKRGTAQGHYDSVNSVIKKSAGASLRRYNERALCQDIQNLIKSWADSVDSCDAIFLRGQSFNKAIFFGGKLPPFKRSDDRIRVISIATRRPTFKELKRVQSELSTVHIIIENNELDCDQWIDSQDNSLCSPDNSLCSAHDTNIQPVDGVKLTTKKSYMVSDRLCKSDKIQKPELPQILSSSNSDEDPYDLNFSEQCFSTRDLKETDVVVLEHSKKRQRKRKPKPKLSPSDQMKFDAWKIFETHVLSGDDEGVREAVDKFDDKNKQISLSDVINYLVHGETLLHIASKSSHTKCVWLLMLIGVDPSVKNMMKQTAYCVSGDKITRNEFRRFVGQFPDMYDYTQSQIPSALTEDMEQTRLKQKTEKQQIKKQNKRDKEKEMKIIKKQEEEETKQKEIFLNMSDREKHAHAAELRFAKQKAEQGDSYNRCWSCGASLVSKVPFSYFDYKFCSMFCLRIHKQE